MAEEIKRPDIANDEAANFPKEWAKDWKLLGVELDTTIGKLKLIETSIGGAKNTPKLKKDTQELTLAQKELAKTTQQILVTEAKMNEENLKASKVLEQTKKQLKEKAMLTSAEAKNVTAQKDSIEKLSAALKRNRADYDALAGSKERDSEAGEALLSIIQQQDEDLKKLKVEYGQAQLKVGDYEGAIKTLKTELKATRDQLAGIAITLGENSEEYKKAAERAGELKNQLSTIDDNIKNFAGDTSIERLGVQVGGLKDKLANLNFKGATVQLKAIQQTIKDTSFKAAIDGAGGFSKALLGVGKALLGNPLIYIPLILIAIGTAVVALKDSVPLLSAAFDAVGDALAYVVQKGKEFSDWAFRTSFVAQDKANAIINAAKAETEAIRDRYDDEIAIAEAAGKDVSKLEKEKQLAIIHEAALGLQALEEQRARFNGKWKGDQEKQYKELLEIVKNANKEIQIAENIAREERRIRALNDNYELQKFLLQTEIDGAAAIVDNDNKTFEQRFNAQEKLTAAKEKLAILENARALELAKEDRLTTSMALEQMAKEHEENLRKIRQDGQMATDDLTFEELEAQQKVNEALLALEKMRFEDIATARKNFLDLQLKEIKDNAIAGGMSKEAADKLLVQKQKELADDYIQIEISKQQSLRALAAEGSDEQKKIDEALFKLRMDLTQAYYEQIEKGIKGLDVGAFIDKYKQAFEKFIGSIADLSASFTEQRLQELDIEQDRSEKKRNEEENAEKERLDRLLANETLTTEQRDGLKDQSEARQTQIEIAAEKRQEDIDARRRQAVRRQAIFDKAVALTMAGIDLARAIVAMLQVGPAGFALSALAVATGSVQLGVIAAKPIPAARKGIVNFEGGLIRAGEEGPELAKEPGDRWKILDKDGIYNMAKGTTIFDHRRSMSMMAAANRPPVVGGHNAGDTRTHKELKLIRRAIQKQKVPTGNGYVQDGTRVRYINKLRNT